MERCKDHGKWYKSIEDVKLLTEFRFRSELLSIDRRPNYEFIEVTFPD